MDHEIVHVWPAYRRGYYVTKDLDSRWPGAFDWRVAGHLYGRHNGLYTVGWFGSLESAYEWIYKQPPVWGCPQ